MEENVLYMYFVKDGNTYAKKLELKGDPEALIVEAKKIAEFGIKTWAEKGE